MSSSAAGPTGDLSEDRLSWHIDRERSIDPDRWTRPTRDGDLQWNICQTSIEPSSVEHSISEDQ